jgi:pyruvate kinase
MHTKILATVGPASSDPAMLRRLALVGVRAFRLNFSHGGRADFAPVVEAIRGLERELGEPMTIVQDLRGPKLRICPLMDTGVEASRDEDFILGPYREDLLHGEQGRRYVCFNNKDVMGQLIPGDRAILSDGQLIFKVVERAGPEHLLIRALNDGYSPPGKGIAFPGKFLHLEAPTEKDLLDVRAGAELGVDAVAVSHARDRQDLHRVREELSTLGSRAFIIAKIERREAVDNLQEMIDGSDAVLIARGDLGLSMSLSGMPALQKRIIEQANQSSKPVIVATQMLHSMVRSPRPTRAETTDVANAILDGADCLMLSEETAIGIDPPAAVEQMQGIAREAEAYFYEEIDGGPLPIFEEGGAGEYLGYAACLLARKAAATAICAHTLSGGSARILAACRPIQPIYTLSPDLKVRRFLNLCRGVLPRPANLDIEQHLDRAHFFIDTAADFQAGDMVVVTAGQPKPKQTLPKTNLVKLYVK